VSVLINRNFIIQVVLLMTFWLLLSGHYDFFHIFLGVISVALVVGLNYRLRNHRIFREELKQQTRLRIFRLFVYVPWLLWQIVVSSIQVAYVVLHPSVPADPSLVRFKTRLPNTGSKVILGNSITLTPGTLTLEIKDDEFLVHALSDVSSSGIVSGELPGQVAKLYAERPKDVVSNIRIVKSSRDL
jgi:multicomponent Na+:H+ antiporter subunit E